VRGLLIVVSVTPYAVLMLAFAAGVWAAVGPKRTGRITAALLATYAVTGLVTPLFFQAPTREALASGTDTWRNTMHLPLTAVSVVSILLAMGFGATLLGKGFRWYSSGSIATLIVFAAVTGILAARMVGDQPTPWMGLTERVNIYGTMLWMAALAMGLWRAGEMVAPGEQEQPTLPPRGVQAVPH
jgi:hypothetical protein